MKPHKDDKQQSTRNPWGDKPIKDMTQKEFEAKHRENQQKDNRR